MKLIVELFIALMLTVTSGDLLYFYFIGAWGDPTRAIEIAELFFLVVFILLGIGYIVWRIRTERRG